MPTSAAPTSTDHTPSDYTTFAEATSQLLGINDKRILDHESTTHYK